MFKLADNKKIIASFIFCVSVLVGCSDQQENKTENHHNEKNGVKLSKQVIHENGIKLASVGAAEIATQLEVIGKVVPNQDQTAPIYPRFTGIVKSLSKQLGDTVNANEVIARVESNESLQAYDIRAPFKGVVIQKFANVGALVKEDKPLYEISDLSIVWIDLSIYRKEASKVKKEQAVYIKSEGNHVNQADAKIDYVSPIGAEDSQTLLARVFLPNTTNEWLPGMYVDALITIDKKQVSMAVTNNAIQKLEGKSVVFVQQGDEFVATEVQTGIHDSKMTEIISGLKTGQNYVSENSFILKAELGKGAAEHEH